MRTLKHFISRLDTIPVMTSWYLPPGVGIDMIRRVLKDLQKLGGIECLGRGRNARWSKKRELDNIY